MITIDARFLNNSGIGIYLRNVIPGIVSRFPDKTISLMGDPSVISSVEGLANSPNVIVIPAFAKMYSIHEQIDYLKLIPKETKLYFATHYNVPLLYRGKMLVTVYDLFHLAMPNMVGGIHKTLYAKWMFNAVRRKASSIITISEFTKNELLRLTGPQGNQAIIPIHLGVNKSWFAIPKKSSPHPRPFILAVGNVKPHKNLGSLIKAFSLIAHQFPHDLVLVGQKAGLITGDNELPTTSEGLSSRIHFTGRVNQEILEQYFAHATCLIFPSLYEGFGLPPLEAMAAKCPVISSNAGSMQEVCGNAVLYFDPHNPQQLAKKIQIVLSDHTVRDSLIMRGRSHVENFTWDHCINQTSKVIHTLISEP
jgi:glycosyltransferase involved in cell wall biosynthesis